MKHKPTAADAAPQFQTTANGLDGYTNSSAVLGNTADAIRNTTVIVSQTICIEPIYCAQRRLG
jgi:hypothetical protein